jgi:hypothetical protein
MRSRSTDEPSPFSRQGARRSIPTKRSDVPYPTLTRYPRRGASPAMNSRRGIRPSPRYCRIGSLSRRGCVSGLEASVFQFFSRHLHLLAGRGWVRLLE